VIVSPGGDGVVDVLDGRDTTDEHCEDSEHEAAEKRHRERERQQHPCRDRSIEAPHNESAQARVLPDLLADGAGDLLGRSLRRER